MAQGDPWDDSVLVNALDKALSSYKSLHRLTDNNKELETEVKEVDEKEEASTVDFVPNDSMVATDQQVSDTSFSANNNSNPKGSEDPLGGIHVNGTSNVSLNQGQDSHTTDVLCEEEFKGVSDESIVQYNLLEKQYIDLREQQEKIVMQMHQMYQANEKLYTQYPMTNQFKYQSQIPYTYPSAYPATSSYPEGSGFYPLAFNTGATENGKCYTQEKPQNPELQNNVNETETDLAQVIGAWYSAGFYTGRYVEQQSLKKNGQ